MYHLLHSLIFPLFGVHMTALGPSFVKLFNVIEVIVNGIIFYHHWDNFQPECYRQFTILLNFDRFTTFLDQEKTSKLYPPASEASREVPNLTERKNPHNPVFGDKEFVCLSFCLFNFTKDCLIFHLNRTKNHLKKSLLLWLPQLFL